ncbi:MAG: hypothetical protein NTW19_18640 [Planctomycetota bacterium]|nr:hypothetical protein [Planctomycetota bacterium]
MTEQESQLVQMIAREVLAVLRSRGLAAASGGTQSAPSGSSDSARVHIQPPVGVCTGDYSKFPELAAKMKSIGAAPPAGAGSSPASSVSESASPSSSSAPAPTVEPIALSGIVTANQLEAAFKANPDGVAVLAADARLTPLANDLARQHAKRVRRLGASESAAASSASSSGGGGAPNADLPWVWWIDGVCPVVQEVTTVRRQRLRRSGANATPGALGQAIRDLAAAVKSKRVAGGLLFVHSAARAVCLANRCPSLRAVVGTCGESVEEAVQQLGANVLIVEYPHHGLRSASAMVDRIMQSVPQAPPAVERDLADLNRCG